MIAVFKYLKNINSGEQDKLFKLMSLNNSGGPKTDVRNNFTLIPLQENSTFLQNLVTASAYTMPIC